MPKFRLTLTKSVVIDLAETQGAGWAEQALDYLQAKNVIATIKGADIDTLTGALIQVVDWDVYAAIDDLEITSTDFKIEVLSEEEPK